MKLRTLRRSRQNFAWCVYWAEREKEQDRLKRLSWSNAERHYAWERNIRHKGRHFKPGTVIETCGVDVARIVEIDGRDITYKYMFGRYCDSTGSCCLINCGPVRLTEEGIKRRKEIFDKEGHKGLVRRWWREDCHMTDEQIAEAEAGHA